MNPFVGENYALYSASCYGYDKIVKFLLDLGLTHNLAFRTACCNNHPNVVKLLLDNQSDNEIEYLLKEVIKEPIKEMLLQYKYRTDEPEYQQKAQQILTYVNQQECEIDTGMISPQDSNGSLQGNSILIGRDTIMHNSFIALD